MAKVKHIHHSKNSVVRSMASSNTWIIGLLLVLGSIVVVTWYNFSTFHDVKGVATKAADLRPSIPPKEPNDRIANGCFVLKDNFTVLQKCGDGLFRYAQYSCGDNTKIKLGSPTSCKSVTNWLLTIAPSCKGHTSCDTRPTPSIRPSGHPTPTPKTTGFPSPKTTPTPTIATTPTTVATPTVGTQK